MTSKLSAKFLEIFRNLKSDAVPRPPRRNESFPEDNSQAEAQNENVDFPDNQEEIFVEQDEPKKGKKPKYKKSFSVPNRESPDMPEDDRRSSNASSVVNTQATGNVINIVNSKDVRCGNEIFYYMGPVYGHRGQPNTSTPTFDDEEPVEKTNLIQLLLEAKNKPEHDYIDYISKHLGKNWHSFFRRLGYKQGQIETAEIDMAKNGVAEARYKLLLDWIRNDVDGTLGKLANVLWEDGERQIVKELAAMYNKTKG
ncbi:receptor-interacting serine/threonine-protein kinase 1-like [Maniola jurtina]|uniref:receptor-interacting serine/threonine-protein kinase 1-like n=1 Tax=Maniola jurtina TaxID=191418 RepID=UPI001E68F250|nr:receptor-interacting serine/threonine-protein kinase 1-like [Maniola jurtina]